MIIACLGWGSLVWDPRGLPIVPKWHDDGPFAPIEFVRQSQDGRMTLVIDDKSEYVRTLWAQMTLKDLRAAKEALKDREGLLGKEWEKNIGVWKKDDASPKNIPTLASWATANGIDAVIWTNLKPKFAGKEDRPSSPMVIDHLKALRGTQMSLAKEYIEKAPHQISTQYRRDIEAQLGWLPLKQP